MLLFFCCLGGDVTSVGAGARRSSSPSGDEGRASGSGSGSTGRLVEDTLSYTVQSSDTLTSLAARFDTTPSELVSLNKLHSRLIFPGQVLASLTWTLATFLCSLCCQMKTLLFCLKRIEVCSVIGLTRCKGHCDQNWIGLIRF